MFHQLILFNMPLTILAGGLFVLLKIPNRLRISAMAGAALLNVFSTPRIRPFPLLLMILTGGA